MAEARSTTETIARIPEPGELDALATEENEVSRRVSEGRGAVEKATKAADAAVKATTDLERKLGTESVLSGARSKAETRIGLLGEVASVGAERDSDMKEAARLNKESTAAEKAEKKAVAAFEATKDARHAAERAHQAHALRSTLSPGEPCPVCEQTVDVLPRGAAPAALGRTEAAQQKAQENLEAARATGERIRSLVTAAETRVTALTKEHDRATKRLTALDAELVEMVGRAKDPLAEVDGRLERVADARRNEVEALQAKGEALAGLSSCEEVESTFVKRRRARRGAAHRGSGPDGPHRAGDRGSLRRPGTDIGRGQIHADVPGRGRRGGARESPHGTGGGGRGARGCARSLRARSGDHDRVQRERTRRRRQPWPSAKPQS